MNFGYTQNIPFSTHNPSDDQPLMLQNTNSEFGIWQIDHFGFKDANGGLHKQVRMPQEALPTVGVGFGGLYVNAAPNLSSINKSNLFYTPDNSGIAYQLTRTDTPNSATFGTNTNYPSVIIDANQVGGWTFLPGGLILQYGTMLATSNETEIAFPVPFPSAVFSLSAILNQIGGSTISWGYRTLTTAGFKFTASSNIVNTRFYWSAIGK